MYDNERECREYILQCWAEAKERYQHGEMPNYANRSLVEQYGAAQEEAMEDDWRIGAMEQFLNRQPLGGLVCIRQIKHEALSVNREFPQDPTPKESQEIGVLMNKFSEWGKAGRRVVGTYGRQRCWERIKAPSDKQNDFDELPFE